MTRWADLLRRLRLRPLGPLPPAMRATWQRHLGLPAWAALALVVVAGWLQWQLYPTLRSEHAGLEHRLQALMVAPATAPMSSPADTARSTSESLPLSRARARDLEWLVLAAERHGLALDRADYSLGAATQSGLSRVEATLPLAGGYSALRRYLADALNELPNAALESLQIERANAQSTRLQATARLVLFYRQESP